MPGARLSARRALGVAAAGLGMTLIALGFDAAPLFVPALALVAIGVLTPAWVWITAQGARTERILSTDRVVEEAPLSATILVRRGRLGLPGAEVVDRFTRSRFELSGPLSPVRGGREAQVRVLTRFPRRGLVRLPPPVLHIRDPLDLAHVETSAGGAGQTLLVLPRTEPVRWAGAGRGRRLSLREGHAAAEALAAVDLDGLRPYRTGTPASRIHWPAVARGAGLIERRLRADGDARPLVVLDARGAVSPEHLDAAVRAAASLTLELARSGGCGLLLPGDQRALAIDRELARWPAAHARLALVESDSALGAPALGAPGPRLGAMVYVAPRAPLRLLASADASRGIVLVVPLATLAAGRPAGLRVPAHPVLEVCGCRGFQLGAGRAPEGPRRARAGAT